jgi:4-hydroxy-tetrahydrodipicolinate synthase
MRPRGILTAMVTPFDADLRVDEAAFVRLLHHLLEHGSDGVVVAATTGESPTLTDDEKLRLWELAVAEAGGAPVIAGTGTYDTAHSVHLTERASELGVDGVLAVTPYYNKPNERGLRAHFEAIAGATELPVVLYNIPSRCVVDMSNDFLAELAQIPNVAGLDLLAGNDDMLAHCLDAGGTGGILVASQVVGEEMRRMIDEPERRAEIHASLSDVFAAMSVTTNPMPIKAALRMLGHDVGGFRLPLVVGRLDELATIRTALERHGLLARAA